MRLGLKIILSLSILIFILSCRIKTANITAVKYFPVANPRNNVTNDFTVLNRDSMEFYLSKFRRISGAFYKGSTGYLQVEYKNGRKLVLQFPHRAPDIVRVADKKFNLFTDKWYVIKDTVVARQWIRMIRRQEKLSKD